MPQNSPEMVKTDSCYSGFGYVMKLDDNSTAHAKLYKFLYLPLVLNNGTESSRRRQERETNFDKLGEPSSQVICNVLSTFKYRGADTVPVVQKAYRGSPGAGTSC